MKSSIIISHFNSLQLESKDADMTILERGTWLNNMIEPNIYVFFFQQTLDILVTSTRSSNYGDINWKATVVFRIYKKASSTILGYQTLLNAKVTGHICLLPVHWRRKSFRLRVRSFRKRVIIRFADDFPSNGELFWVKTIVTAKNLRVITRSLSLWRRFSLFPSWGIALDYASK